MLYVAGPNTGIWKLPDNFNPANGFVLPQFPYVAKAAGDPNRWGFTIASKRIFVTNGEGLFFWSQNGCPLTPILTSLIGPGGNSGPQAGIAATLDGVLWASGNSSLWNLVWNQQLSQGDYSPIKQPNGAGGPNELYYRAGVLVSCDSDTLRFVRTNGTNRLNVGDLMRGITGIELGLQPIGGVPYTPMAVYVTGETILRVTVGWSNNNDVQNNIQYANSRVFELEIENLAASPGTPAHFNVTNNWQITGQIWGVTRANSDLIVALLGRGCVRNVTQNYDVFLPNEDYAKWIQWVPDNEAP
ncbi:MAG TPA: hypothetical protein VFE46_13745 [Pirellulales bacterium]|nr:hypothetical protein [Pirellulales bacterium]